MFQNCLLNQIHGCQHIRGSGTAQIDHEAGVLFRYLRAAYLETTKPCTRG